MRAPGTVVQDKRTLRWRVRVRVVLADGTKKRVWLSGPTRTGYPTREDAERARRAATLVRDDEMRGGGMAPADTVREWGELVLERRALDGYRNVRSERSAWRCYVEGAPFIDYPLGAVKRAHIRDFLRSVAHAPRHASHNRKNEASRPPSRATIRNLKALLSAVFAVAFEEEYIAENPCLGVKVPGRPAPAREMYMAPDDVRAWATATAIPETERCVGLVLVGTGMRLGELVWMPASNATLDGDQPSCLVQYGSTDAGTRERLSPKSKKFRRVPLFGLALWAWRRFRALTASWPNPHGLAFPREDGSPRAIASSGRAEFRRWETYRAAAGLPRALRVHDLRHTCASLLLTGAMSELIGEPLRRWTLIEIRDLLGHSSVKVTERYAHLAPSALDAAARETHGKAWGADETGDGLPPGYGPAYKENSGMGNEAQKAAENAVECTGRGLNPHALRRRNLNPHAGRENAEDFADGGPAALAVAFLAALAAGDVDPARLAALATALVAIVAADDGDARVRAAAAAARALLGVAS